MNLLYTVNDAYVPQLSASIASVFENNRDADSIHVYVFSDGISESNRHKLGQFCASYDRSISFISIDNFMERWDIDFDTKGWNEIVLSRLFLGSLLPSDVDRVLYLDADTIIRRPISQMYFHVFNASHFVGACMEATVDSGRMGTIDHVDLPYYNAGVLLVDVTGWRRADAERRLMECLTTRRDSLFANDQDAINIVLAEEIESLPIQYNACNTYQYYPLRFLKKISPWFSATAEEYTEARDNPSIVHYLGEERPWREGCTHRYVSDYWRYLSRGPWASTPRERGWTTYFRVWTLFNGMTHYAPSFRYHVITSMIPSFMKYRARTRRRDS